MKNNMPYKHIIILTTLLLFTSMSIKSQQTIFDFNKTHSTESWQIINDGVMGGLSKSSIRLTENENGLFSGHISLANNGGFASVRLLTDVKLQKDSKFIKLRIKGDGKTYQFRLKSDRNQRQSYVQVFETNGEWQTVELKINDFSPQFRGRQLDMPNFNFSKIEEVRFLIANKKEEDFELLISSIELK